MICLVSMSAGVSCRAVQRVCGGSASSRVEVRAAPGETRRGRGSGNRACSQHQREQAARNITRQHVFVSRTCVCVCGDANRRSLLWMLKRLGSSRAAARRRSRPPRAPGRRRRLERRRGRAAPATPVAPRVLPCAAPPKPPPAACARGRRESGRYPRAPCGRGGAGGRTAPGTGVVGKAKGRRSGSGPLAPDSKTKS
jgi:hypothetical protein